MLKKLDFIYAEVIFHVFIQWSTLHKKGIDYLSINKLCVWSNVSLGWKSAISLKVGLNTSGVVL